MFLVYMGPIKRQREVKLLNFTQAQAEESTINDAGLGVNAQQSVL